MNINDLSAKAQWNIIVRVIVFAGVVFVAHLSNLNWSTFVLGAFWGVGVAAYPGRLNYDK